MSVLRNAQELFLGCQNVCSVTELGKGESLQPGTQPPDSLSRLTQGQVAQERLCSRLTSAGALPLGPSALLKRHYHLSVFLIKPLDKQTPLSLKQLTKRPAYAHKKSSNGPGKCYKPISYSINIQCCIIGHRLLHAWCVICLLLHG